MGEEAYFFRGSFAIVFAKGKLGNLLNVNAFAGQCFG